MTFSYTNDPAGREIDAVRLLVGDTDASEPFLQDEEIAFLVATWARVGSVYYTASTAAEAIAAKLTREVTINADGQSLSASELQQKYLQLAETLRAQHKELLAGGTIYAGGMDAGKQPDHTVAPLSFGTRMHDHREAGRQDFGDLSDIITSWEAGHWGEFVQ